jgi:predicted ATPase
MRSSTGPAAPAGADGGGSARSTAALLERDQFLAALRDCPPGHVVLVAGEAGIGKTALVRAFCEGEERLSLWGACDALRTPRPLGPLRDMARQLDTRLARAVATESARFTLFSAFLDELAARPTVAVVEDAHWADEATLDLLLFLGRRIWQTRSLLIVTYRDEEVDPGHPLRTVLGALAGHREVRRINLPPLSPRAVARLAAARDLDGTELHARTAATRSSSPRFWPTPIRRYPRPCATRCSPARRASASRRGKRCTRRRSFPDTRRCR